MLHTAGAGDIVSWLQGSPAAPAAPGTPQWSHYRHCSVYCHLPGLGGGWWQCSGGWGRCVGGRVGAGAAGDMRRAAVVVSSAARADTHPAPAPAPVPCPGHVDTRPPRPRPRPPPRHGHGQLLPGGGGGLRGGRQHDQGNSHQQLAMAVYTVQGTDFLL